MVARARFENYKIYDDDDDDDDVSKESHKPSFVYYMRVILKTLKDCAFLFLYKYILNNLIYIYIFSYF